MQLLGFSAAELRPIIAWQAKLIPPLHEPNHNHKQSFSPKHLLDVEQHLSYNLDRVCFTGAYITFNLEASTIERETPLIQLYDALRPEYTPLMQSYQCRNSDPTKASLVTLGKAGTGTPWHRDATEGKNIVFSLQPHCPEVGDQVAVNLELTPLALWLFIEPGKEEEVEEWQVKLPCQSCLL